MAHCSGFRRGQRRVGPGRVCQRLNTVCVRCAAEFELNPSCAMQWPRRVADMRTLYRSTGDVWQTTPKQCHDISPCIATEMIRLLGTLDDLPIFRVCQTLAVLG